MSSNDEAEPAKRQRRRRGSINAEHILAGAFALSREDSLDNLTMLRLADHLDIGVTSLYWYYRSKDELFEAMSTEAFRIFYERMTPPEAEHWDDALRQYFREFRSILKDDPVICDLVVVRVEYIRPEGLIVFMRHADRLLAKLVGAGFTPAEALQAYNALSIFVRGSNFIDRSREAGGHVQGFAADLKRTLGAGEAETLPALTAAVRASEASVDDEFEFGLENAIRGLRAVLADKAARPSA